MRKKLVEAILDLAGDEMDKDGLTKLAKKTNHELINDLISIAEYYRDEAND